MVTLGLMLIWCALLRDQMAVLSEEHVEVGPSTFAALVHVVASHQKLWREHWWLLCVLELQSCLHDLGEGDGVA